MPEAIFADTNLFLRYLMNDDPPQADAVEQVLIRAKNGEFRLVANALVMAEIVWVLEKVYNLERLTIRESIFAIINTPGLDIAEADLITQALDWYAGQNIDFVDAFSACWMQAQQIDAVYTFDNRHFSRIDQLNVLVPGQET